MSHFLDALDVTETSDKIWSISGHPFRYQSDVAARTFTVPVDFFTDFASVPRWMPIIYAMLGDKAHEAAAVHDWLYYAAITTREMADEVFREAIEVCNIPHWQANLFYAGVRTGGWSAWNEHRRLGDPLIGKFADSPDIIALGALSGTP